MTQMTTGQGDVTQPVSGAAGAPRRTTVLLSSDGQSLPGQAFIALLTPSTSRAVRLEEGRPLVVGRDAEACEVVLDEPSLSRRHARFCVEGGRVMVEDLGSRNGTFVDGAPISGSHAVELGERVILGQVEATIVTRHLDRPPLSAFDMHESMVSLLAHELGRLRALRGRKGRDQAPADAFVSLLLVRGPGPLLDWALELVEHLEDASVGGQGDDGPFHFRVGQYSADTLSLLLVHPRPDQAEALAEGIGGAAAVGVAPLMWPCRGGAQGLFDRALAALEACPEGRGFRFAEGARAVEPGRAAERVEPSHGWLDGLVDERLAESDFSLLLAGEPGTGKEVLAHRVHQRSTRAEQPFIVVDCAVLGGDTVKSELFGHVAGAFTGAHTDRQSVFEQASGGTVLLDEIGELPLDVQTMLLRVLEDRTISRLGTNDRVAVDFRLLAATNRDLVAMVGDGTFRQDLFDRLGGTNSVVAIPPLRDCATRIPALVDDMLAALAERYPKRALPTRVEPAALEVLARQEWRGNVRELRNVIERACLLARGDTIGIDDLPRTLTGNAVMPQPWPLDNVKRPRPENDAPVAPPPEGAAAAAPDAEEPAADVGTFAERVDAFEREVVFAALRATGNNRSAAARLLTIPRRTLTEKLKRWSDEGLLPEGLRGAHR